MTPEQWRRLAPWLDRALELDGAARAGLLDSLRRDDPALAAELETLLARSPRVEAERFLADPPTGSRPLSLAGQRLGAWTLDSPLGEGGMGTVWLARRNDGRFDGVAAVKLLHAAVAGPSGEARFRREGRILARLSHPCIARLLDAGVAPHGQPYLVLEHVEGSPIDVHCDALGLGVEARLRLFLGVVQAVAAAHSQLVVHRDLKPSNVLVSTRGEVKLLDFGIAKLLEDDATGADASVTRDAGRVFTPAFAAPEQVSGGAIGTATDVYALGALLYLLLAGRRAVGDDASSPVELFRAIAESEPRRLSDTAGGAGAGPGDVAARRGTTPERLRRQLGGDLETIVAKALKREPAERYPSAAALGDDLLRFLEHRPIRARPDSLRYRAEKFVRRHRLPVALVALAATAVAAGVAGTLVQTGRARRHAAAAEAERDFAVRQLARAEAINDLNAFLLREAAPGDAPISVSALLGRAEEIVTSQQEDPDGTRVAILVEVARLYELHSEHVRSRALLERAWELAEASADPAARARAGCALAGALGRSGEGERADELFRRVTAELPEDRQYALAWVDCELRRSELGGDFQANLREVESAARWLAESGIRSSPLELRVAMRRADSYRLAGRHREAEAAFGEAFARLTGLGRGRTQMAADLLNDWALTLRAQGEPRRAEEMFRRALAIEQGAAGGDRNAAAQAGDRASPSLLNNYSRALLDLGRVAEATDYAERAHRAAVAAGDDTTILQSLLQRAAVERSSGDAERASATLAELEPKMVRRLDPTNLRFASLAIEQALVAAARGDASAALASADRAVALSEAGFDRQPQYLRWVLRKRSEVRLRLGRADEAAADAERALALERAASGEGAASSHVGWASLALARARTAQGRGDEAALAAGAALRHLEPTLGGDHEDSREARRLAGGPLS